MSKYFVIDFDSTFTKVEAFDVLADISLNDHPEQEKIKQQIVDITNLGMNGEISFRESLEKRLTLLAPHRNHLPALVTLLKSKVSESCYRKKNFLCYKQDKK
jgi:D-3-phosphoglycerate dehydrogenase